MSGDVTPGLGAAAEIGRQLAQRAISYAFGMAGLEPPAINVHRWLPPGPDPLTASNWWAFREPCGCPDTSFGRNPHRWDCEQTPIWAQTIRDLDCNPWTVVGWAQNRACNEWLDHMVAWWHDLAPDDGTLADFLGMTWDEYKAWTEDPQKLPARWFA